MALQKTEAILLRRQEVRETSLMLVAFSRQLGKVQGLVKGVRGARAAVPWYLEPMTLQSLVLYERRRSPWALISACDLLDAFDPIRRDFQRTAHAFVCLELVDALTGVGDPHPEIFDLLLAALRAMGQSADLRAVLCALEAQLLKASGLLPEVQALPLSTEGKSQLQRLLQAPRTDFPALQLPAPIAAELARFLAAHSRRVMERELRSRAFLQSVGIG